MPQSPDAQERNLLTMIQSGDVPPPPLPPPAIPPGGLAGPSTVPPVIPPGGLAGPSTVPSPNPYEQLTAVTAPLIYNAPVLGGLVRGLLPPEYRGTTFSRAALAALRAPSDQAAQEAFGQEAASILPVGGIGAVGKGPRFIAQEGKTVSTVLDTLTGKANLMFSGKSHAADAAAKAAELNATVPAAERAFAVPAEAQITGALRQVSTDIKDTVRRALRGEGQISPAIEGEIDRALTTARVPVTDDTRRALADAIVAEQRARNAGGAARGAAQRVPGFAQTAEQRIAAGQAPIAPPIRGAGPVIPGEGSPKGPLGQRIAAVQAARFPSAAANEAVATARGQAFEPGTGAALRPTPRLRELAQEELGRREAAPPSSISPAPPTPPAPPALPSGPSPSGEPTPLRPWEKFLSLWNIPKALKASWDISAPGRQGIMTAAAHPGEFFGNFKPMIQAFGSEKFAQAVDDEIRAGPKSPVVQDWLAQRGYAGRSPKLYVAAREGGLSNREEAFMSGLVGKIPLIKGSERAYVTYLNKLRTDIYDNVLESWIRGGKNVSQADYDGLADVINHFTGRGDLPGGSPTVAKATAILNGAFFSPRFVVSRFQSVGDAAGAFKSRDSLAAKEAANMMVKFVGAGLAMLALAKAGGAKVEADPRSADFGKIAVGDTTYDLWGGQQQIARYVAQIISGQSKVGSGKQQGSIQPANRLNTIGRFVLSKTSPSVSTAIGVLGYEKRKTDPGGTIGHDFVGRPFTARDAALGLVTPLAGQDIIDAVQDAARTRGTFVGGVLRGAPTIVGIGTTTRQQ